MLNEPEADNWAQVAPLLDDAMVELGESDRSALALRFFENKF
jgi:cell division protein ZapA (FtsZ GTPase activity inhibitor)